MRRVLYDFLTGVVVFTLFAVRRGKRRQLLAKLRVPPLPEPRPVLRIWLHAVSVGEVRAAIPLINRLFASHPDLQLFLSTATTTGLAIAKQEIPQAAAHFLLPFDFSFHARKLFDRIRPHCLLFSEGDLWPSLLKEARARAVPTALINGKLSPKSARRFSLAPRFSRRLFSLDLLCMQSDKHKQRLAPFLPGKEIHVTGNVKFDRNPPRLDPTALALWKKELRLDPDKPILTIGSTHPGEEELLLGALKELLPICQILLVPRHPERCQNLLHSLRQLGLTCSLLSESSREGILIVDQMGSLCPCYQVSDLAIVAGSFLPGIGGHNLIEPLAYGVPSLFGPHVETQSEMKELILDKQAGLCLTADELPSHILSLLANPHQLSSMKERGAQAAASLQGATEKTYELLKSFLKG